MNTKDKHYKEWLALSKEFYNREYNSEWDKYWDELYCNKYRKFNSFYDNPPKWYINTFNRSDRQHNKQALKKNIVMMGCDYDEDPHDADWFGFLGGWESEYIEYRYHHKNSAKWMWW